MKEILLTDRRHKLRYLRFLAVFAGLALILSLANVLVVRIVGDISQSSASLQLSDLRDNLLRMSALYAVILVFDALLSYLKKRYEGKMSYTLRAAFARHFARIPFLSLSKKKSGEMISLYSADLPATVLAMNSEVFDLLRELMTLLVNAVFMFLLQPLFSLFFFVAFPLLMLLQVVISKPVDQLARDASEKRAQFNHIAVDNLNNTATVVAYGLESKMEQRFSDSYDAYLEATRKRIRVFSSLIIFGILATYLPLVGLFTAAAYSTIRGGMTVGGFVAYTMIATEANSWLMMLAQRIGYLRTRLVSLKRLNENTAEPVETDSGGIAETPDSSGEPAVAFRDVCFSYDGEHPVLNGLNLRVARGERVGIVGPSGCGKSTAIKMMLNLYEPESGTVALFGHETAELPGGGLRALSGYVPQDSFIFPQSIAGNIRCAEVSEDDTARLRAAAEQAGILEFIESLPHGFDTILAQAGDNLSGGQRQRIALARAFYRGAPLLLLDEATSALDPVVEAAILDTFYRSAQNYTAVLVAHRLAAVRSCDRILVMQGGSVVEEGTFEALLSAGGLFTELYNAQQKEVAHAN